MRLADKRAGMNFIVGHHKVGIAGIEPAAVSSGEAIDPEKDPGGYMKVKAKTTARNRTATLIGGSILIN